MKLSKDKMAEYQRERRARLNALKADPRLKVVKPDAVKPCKAVKPDDVKLVKPVNPVKPSVNLKDLEGRVRDLEEMVAAAEKRVRELERQLNPLRKGALKPGGHPTELYGP